MKPDCGMGNNIKFVADLIKKLNRKDNVSGKDVRAAVSLVLGKKISCPDIFLGSLFSSLMYVENLQILQGAIQGALDLDDILSKKVNLNKEVYSIGGSGKDDIKTFNISSTASIVASAMGINVFKVGAPGTSNKLGSQGLLDSLKVLKIKKIKEIKNHCSGNFMYMSVDDIVPNLFSSYDGTFFYPNVLSYGLLPLVTPVKLSGMIYGVSMPNTEISANLLNKFGMKNVLVVAGMDSSGKNFLDEISVIGKTRITFLNSQGIIENFIFDPARLGIVHKKFDRILESKNKKDAKMKVINILKGKASPIEMDAVAVNVGGLLFLSGKSPSIEGGYFMAINFLNQGKAFDYFKDLIG